MSFIFNYFYGNDNSIHAQKNSSKSGTEENLNAVYERIDVLCERVAAKNLIHTEKLSALTELKSLATSHPLLIGTMAMEPLLGLLQDSIDLIEVCQISLDILNILTRAKLAPHNQHALTTINDQSPQFSEIILKNLENFEMFLRLLESDSVNIRFSALLIITNLAYHHLEKLQQFFISVPLAASRILSLANDPSELVSTNFCVLMAYLPTGHTGLQKLFVFEGAFDSYFGMIERSQGSLLDVLHGILILLTNNSTNQMIFLENNFLTRLLPLFHDLPESSESKNSNGRFWTLSKSAVFVSLCNILLQLVSSYLPKKQLKNSKSLILTSGAFASLTKLVVSCVNAPDRVVTQALHVIANIINHDSVSCFKLLNANLKGENLVSLLLNCLVNIKTVPFLRYAVFRVLENCVYCIYPSDTNLFVGEGENKLDWLLGLESLQVVCTGINNVKVDETACFFCLNLLSSAICITHKNSLKNGNETYFVQVLTVLYKMKIIKSEKKIGFIDFCIDHCVNQADYLINKPNPFINFLTVFLFHALNLKMTKIKSKIINKFFDNKNFVQLLHTNYHGESVINLDAFMQSMENEHTFISCQQQHDLPMIVATVQIYFLLGVVIKYNFLDPQKSISIEQLLYYVDNKIEREKYLDTTEKFIRLLRMLPDGNFVNEASKKDSHQIKSLSFYNDHYLYATSCSLSVLKEIFRFLSDEYFCDEIKKNLQHEVEKLKRANDELRRELDEVSSRNVVLGEELSQKEQTIAQQEKFIQELKEYSEKLYAFYTNQNVM